MTPTSLNARTFKVTLEYEGTHFCGWQYQPGLRTVQGHVEEKLAHIFKTKVNCHASGRTDSGVHALAQVAHFKAPTTLPVAIIHKALNDALDRDVAVLDVQEAPAGFHAQYHVKDKTYRYTVLNRAAPSALWRDRAYFYPHPLNLARMRRAAGLLKGTHDFKAFQAASQRTQGMVTVKTLSALTVVKQGDLIDITLTADGFLHKMVRNIVSVLLEVGRGAMPVEQVPILLKSKDRKLLPKTIPGNGLCLMNVRY